VQDGGRPSNHALQADWNPALLLDILSQVASLCR